MKKYFTTYKVEENVYRISGLDGVFCDLFIGEDKVLLFDTGFGFASLKNEVQQITNLPLVIVNSHGHLDHIGGNYHFADCDVYINEDDVELMTQHESHMFRKMSLRGYREKFPELIDENAEDIYLHAKTAAVKYIKEGDVFNIGDMELMAIKLSGHTKGSMALLNKKSRILYSADAIGSYIWLFMPESQPISTYIDSLKKAKSLDFDYIYTGHSMKLFEKSMIDIWLETAEYIDYESGKIFTPPYDVGEEVRICQRIGYKADDYTKEGFASIFISKSKLI